MAHAGARLGKVACTGLALAATTENAYVESMVVDGLPHFASKVKFGKDGISRVLPIGTLCEHEQKRIKRLKEIEPTFEGEIDDGPDT